MYGPSRSPYDNYGNYWGGYSRPPHPPPPPPIPPLEPPPFHPPPPPPPLHFRPMRPPPHTLRPPPPPPPIRSPRPQQQPYQHPHPHPHPHSHPHPHPHSHSHPHPPSRQSHYRQDRKTSVPPHHRPPPPDYPPNPPYSRPRHSNGGLPSRRSSEFWQESEKPESESDSNNVTEPIVGSPLVPRHIEPDPPPPPVNKSVPNNKRPLPVELDPDLPEELVAKFHNNSCELCDVKLNSRIQAKNHYEGKQHQKKVKNYVVENARKDGQPPAKVAKQDVSASKKKIEPLDVSQLYCKCCDLSFTSEQHAQQHYMGRNHQRVLHGLKPLKAGYYNKDTGKWQRMPPDPRVSVERLGLNLDLPSDDEDGDDSKKTLDPDCVKARGRFFCELCNVSATSQDQLDGHTTGQRHLKAVRLEAKKTSTTSTVEWRHD